MTIHSNIKYVDLIKYVSADSVFHCDENPIVLTYDGEFWEVESGPNKGLLFHRPLIIGTVNGRHFSMNCDLYLHQKIEDFGQTAFSQTQEKLSQIICEYPRVSIELRYTGLTEVTIGAILTLVYFGVNFEVMHFDSKTKQYSPLRSTIIDDLVSSQKFVRTLEET